MTAWGKIEKSKYDGRCGECDGSYNTGDPLWFIKGQRGYACSEGCLQHLSARLGMTLDASQGTKQGQTGSTPTNDAPVPVMPVKVKETRLVRCRTCLTDVPEDEGSSFLYNNKFLGEIERVFVCDWCWRLTKAEYNLKVMGLWKPNAKDKQQDAVKEAS